MPGKQEYSLDGAAAKFALACNRADQQRIRRACEYLEEHPDTDGDFSRKDDVGRTVQVKVFRPFVIHYWDDFADRQVRIVRIERLN